MPKIYGQLEQSSLEQLSADPVANTQGRIYQNTTEGRTKLDDGVAKRALLRNDQKMIIGNDGTAANNVRIHKGPSGVIQDVSGSDVTAEGTSSTAIAQRTSRDENLTNGTLPASANIGRSAWLTDQKVLAQDDGAAWRKHVPEFAANDATTGGTVTLAAITTSVVRLTAAITTIQMIPAGFPSQRATLINRTGADLMISHDSGGTAADRIYTGLGANIVFKLNSALNLYYDGTTSRWQVVGEAAGSASGGGAVPASTVVTVQDSYTVLITDDIVLADCSIRNITLTLPSAVGNFGKILTFEKISGPQASRVTFLGTVDGISNPEIWADYAPFIIVSDGAVWKTMADAAGTVFFTHPIMPLGVAAVALTNVNIATLATGTNIDNAIVKLGSIVALFGQTVPSENGIYSVASVGPAARHANYTTAATLKYLVVYADWYNHNTAVGATDNVTEPGGSPVHANDLKFWRQTNNFIDAGGATFTDAVYSGPDTSQTFTIKAPTNARSVTIEVCPFGGNGAGGSTTSAGGGAGNGGAPLILNRLVNPGSNITAIIPSFAKPGTGRIPTVGTAGPSISISVVPPSGPTFSQSFVGGNVGAIPTGAPNSQASIFTTGGPLFSQGGANGTPGTANFWAAGGTSAGTVPGAGGGPGIHAGNPGGGGTTTATQNGLAGGYTNGTGGVIPLASSLYGSGGGGGGGAPASGRPGRGGFGCPGYVKLTFH